MTLLHNGSGESIKFTRSLLKISGIHIKAIALKNGRAQGARLASCCGAGAAGDEEPYKSSGISDHAPDGRQAQPISHMLFGHVSWALDQCAPGSCRNTRHLSPTYILVCSPLLACSDWKKNTSTLTLKWKWKRTGFTDIYEAWLNLAFHFLNWQLGHL